MTRSMGLTTSALRAILRRGPLILCYHGVADLPRADDPEFLCVPPGRFRGHVELLRAAGATFVTVGELAARMDGGPPPGGLVALSFDDGFQDNHAVVLPLLRELGL